MGTPAKSLAILLLPLTLAACLDSDDTRTTSFVESANAEQPFPANYKPEILAFLKTYLNNPAGRARGRDRRAGAAHGGRQRALRSLPALCRAPVRRDLPRAARARRAVRRAAGSTASSPTLPRNVPAPPMRHFPRWKSSRVTSAADSADFGKWAPGLRFQTARGAAADHILARHEPANPLPRPIIRRKGPKSGPLAAACGDSKTEISSAVTCATSLLRHRREATKLRPRCWEKSPGT